MNRICYQDRIEKKIVNEVQTGVLPISRAQHQLLSSTGMSQNLQRIFTENKCDATYHIENDNVTVYAFDDAQVKQALRYVKNNVMQDSLVVDEAAKYFISTQEWDDACAAQQQRSPDNVAIETMTAAG